MGLPGDTVDLFVEGADFYSGSAVTAGNLKDGWCDFKVLGERLLEEHMGSSPKLGAIWYLTPLVSPRALRSFAEHRKQGLWLRAQNMSVTRIIVDPQQSARPRGQLVSGRECRCRTEGEAVSRLRQTDRARQAMVISGCHQRSSTLLSFLDEEYDDRNLVLVPPDFQMPDISNARQFCHRDLKDSRLPDNIPGGVSWKDYARLKSDGRLVERWCNDALSALTAGLVSRLSKRPYRDPGTWLKKVLDDASFRTDMQEKVARFLPSLPVKDRRLDRDPCCTEFIARKLIDAAAKNIVADRGGRYVRHPDHMEGPGEWILEPPSASIRSGWDLVNRAASLYPAVEICDGAKSQVLAMTGSEGHFGWVLKALAAANREMLAWVGGPFPHSKLPGPATGESYSVMASPQLRRMRCFTTRTGENLLFEHHMKHVGLNIRMHYRVDQDRRRLMIGYVGRHLPTALF
ncbi:hypothetical protein SBA4_6610003 [Candidatus Sulfopaludibacter sp. SbA4]|nr:hypothetical protein SBA4_6610003 [Candidatus Sulfopaludibacter sp. SbA4]